MNYDSKNQSRRANIRWGNAEDRFWKRVDKQQDCWIWLGAKQGSGYGTCRHPQTQKNDGAHRIAYYFKYGLIPNGLFVLHRCDNKLCVNPNHLFLGTQKDNVKDCILKNRNAKGKDLNHPTQIGSKNHNSKLTENIIKEIRDKYKKGYSKQQLAKQYNTHKTNIHYIVNHKTWKHVE